MTSENLDASTLPKLEKIAGKISANWKRESKSQVLWLQGPMGSGKTTFVRYLVGEQASSPSFALQQVYDVKGGEIQHWDLDRINSPEELEATGFFDIFSITDRKKLIAIEWANRLEEFGRELYCPSGWKAFRVKWIGRDADRTIEITSI